MVAISSYDRPSTCRSRMQDRYSGRSRAIACSIAEPDPDLPHAPYLLGVCSTGTALLSLFSIERLVALSDIPELDA